MPIYNGNFKKFVGTNDAYIDIIFFTMQNHKIAENIGKNH